MLSSKAKDIDLTQGSIGKGLLLFSVPMFIGNLFQQLYTIVDSLVVGNFLGKIAVASIGNSFPAIFIMNSLNIGLSIGASIVVSQYYGAKDKKKLRESIGSIYILVFLFTLALTILGLSITDLLLRSMNTPQDIYYSSKLYMQILIGGSIFVAGYNTATGIMRAVGDTRSPLLFLIISSIINAVLDLIFVLVFKWGLAGVAFATIFSQAISLILCLVYMYRKYPELSLCKENLIYSKDMGIKVMKVGLPAGVQQGITALSVFVIQRIVNSFGSSVVAGFNLAIRVDSIGIMLYSTVNMATSTFTGQNVGAGDYERIKKGVKITTITISTVALAMSIAMTLFGGFLISLFNKDPEVIKAGARMLTVVARFYIFLALLQNFTGIVQGAGAATAAMLINGFSQCIVRAMVSYALAYKLNSVDGVWYGFGSGWIVGATLALIYFISGKWKTKSLVDSIKTEKEVLI